MKDKGIAENKSQIIRYYSTLWIILSFFFFFEGLRDLVSTVGTLVDPLGLFKPKVNNGAQATSNAQSLGGNFNIGPVGFGGGLSSASASANGNAGGNLASASANANTQPNGYGGYGGQNANANAQANANANVLGKLVYFVYINKDIFLFCFSFQACK